MLKKTVIDLSKPRFVIDGKGRPQPNPERRRVVTVSPAEEAAIRDEWARNEQAVKAQAARQIEIDELRSLRKELLDARAVGDEPDAVTVSRYKELRGKYPDA